MLDPISIKNKENKDTGPMNLINLLCLFLFIKKITMQIKIESKAALLFDRNNPKMEKARRKIWTGINQKLRRSAEKKECTQCNPTSQMITLLVD